MYHAMNSIMAKSLNNDVVMHDFLPRFIIFISDHAYHRKAADENGILHAHWLYTFI